MPYDRDILVAEFLLTSASRSPSAIAELLVFTKGDHNKPSHRDDK